MIDLHCHLLPGVDDGAQNMAEALVLARAAVDDGISCAVLTPHMHEGRYDNSLTSLTPSLQVFRDELAKHQIPLQLGLAAEVHVGIEVLDWLEAGEVPFLGKYQGRDVILLEFPHGQIPPGADKLMRRLIGQGLLPLLAHPERNKQVIRNLDAIKPFIEMGCLLQVTAGSVVGAFGPQAQTRAREMLERNWVHILASDAHNIDWRPPNLTLGREAAAQIIGQQESLALVTERPWEIAREHFGGHFEC